MSVGRVISRAPLTAFAEVVRLCTPDLLRIFLISPWIVSKAASDFVPLSSIIAAAQSSGAKLSVLTRTPAYESHHQAVERCRQLPNCEVLFLDSLHAKLYLLQSRYLRVAMMGSPNFTPSGDRVHRELALELRSVKDSDASAALIDDLFLYGRDLMSDRDARVSQRLRWSPR